MTEKIAIFIGNLGGGGAQGVCVTLFNGFIKRKIDVDLVVLSLDDAVRKEDVIDKSKIVNLKAKHARRSVFKIYNYIINEKPKVVLSFTKELSVILIALRLISKNNYRIVSRNITISSKADKYKKRIWYKHINSLIKIFYRQSDLVIAQSHSMATDIRKYYNINQEKIFAIYNPLKPKYEKCNSIHVKQGDGDYLLCVGRLEPSKALHYAIHALAELGEDCSKVSGLKILGEGSLRDDLEALAQEVGLRGRVEFLGYQKNIMPYYVNARLTLLTSLFEGLPNVLIESIACGTPVVAFDCPGGVGEIVIDGVNGFLIKERSVKSLVKGIKKALGYNWDKEKIIKSSEKFNAAFIVDEYMRALQLL